MSLTNDLIARLEKCADNGPLWIPDAEDFRAAAAAVRLVEKARKVMESCEGRIDGIPDDAGNIVDCVSQLRATIAAISAWEASHG